MPSEFRTPKSYPTKNNDYYLTWNTLRILDPSTLYKKKNDWLYYLTWKVFRISDPSTFIPEKTMIIT